MAAYAETGAYEAWAGEAEPYASSGGWANVDVSGDPGAGASECVYVAVWADA